jgi:thioredoxin reductase (NADPH)
VNRPHSPRPASGAPAAARDFDDKENAMPATTDRRPVIITVSGDDRSRTQITDALGRWFASDYRILAVKTPSELVELALGSRDAATEVALVIAEQQLPSDLGTSLLGRIRDVLPTSRRVILASWGDARPAPSEITRASLVGDIDHVVGWPWSVTDEQFLATIGDLLAEWSTEHGRFVESARLVAEPGDAGAHVLRDLVVRWAVPLGFYDTDSDLGRKLAQQLPSGTELPAVFLPDGGVLSRPDIRDIANALGANASLSDPFDVVIAGSGPAGLAAAVYGVSEGLRTLIVEPAALGGQASSSPQIRNYLGFPGGISGSELMVRALEQAWAFGLGMQIGRSVVDFREDGDTRIVELDDGATARARSIVLAMGVTYRKIGIPSVERLVGRGVFYGSGATEASGVVGEDAFVVGGGNSGGQATVNLARFARHVTLLVRGDSLDGMSDYLIQQLRDRSNIEVLLNTQMVEARGRQRLESLVLEDRSDGSRQERDAFAVFILIGATPRTGWLPAAIERDPRGFVLTGGDIQAGSDGSTPTLETSLPGVFAAGDVRHGSVKRVAAAVGEGATAIREIHGYLAEARTEPRTEALAAAR